jgi:sodium transport system permease protein
VQAAFAIPALGPTGALVSPSYLAGAAALASHPALNYPLLVKDGNIVLPPGGPPSHKPTAEGATTHLKIKFLDAGAAARALERKEVDLVLSASPEFWSGLSAEGGLRSYLQVQTRKGDDSSRLAVNRLYAVMDLWKKDFRRVHLARKNLPSDYDDPFQVRDPNTAEAAVVSSEAATDLLVRIFPFMLVMWSLAGALYPAVDVCAGEKERGTMETLLITPAAREEIVWGKFLTIWVFSGATALLNLASMGLTTWQFRDQLPNASLDPLGLAWCVVLLLPLSAFFSAVCLAIGAYARSSKEGQYYLMPLFLVTMPLIFLTLAPGVELNSFYSMVPVTGVVLLMQHVMTAKALGWAPWFYCVAVLAPIALYCWLALRWAIEQFQREEVLFREAERWDVGLWLRQLFRDKEPTPTAGQALFCFGLLLALRWGSLSVGQDVPLLVRTGVVLVAFVAAPALFMGLLLTTRPRDGLSLRLPALPYVLVALLLLPLADLTYHLLCQFPNVLVLLQDRQLLVEQAFRVGREDSQVAWSGYVFVLALVSAVAKEVAFRGLILNGLRRRFRPWLAIFISSLLFAVFHMNVFVLAPAFLLGVALGVLAVRSGSLLPGILLHLGCYAVLLEPRQLGFLGELVPGDRLLLRTVITAVCALLALAILWRLGGTGDVRGRLLALFRLPSLAALPGCSEARR